MKNGTSVDITPDKSLMKKLGMVGYKTEQAVAELIDNSIDARIEGVGEKINVDLDFKGRRIIVRDDGRGMSIRQLADAMTIAKESKEDKRLGRFGIGMKSACSALGRKFLVCTSEAGSDVEYRAEYDEDEWLSDESRSWNNFNITEEPIKRRQRHGTLIMISEIRVPLYPNQVSRFRDNFGMRYGPYLQDDQVSIRINSFYCRPKEFNVVPRSRIPVDIRLEFGHRITGYLELLKQHSVRGRYGINLFKNGRLIKAFEKFGFPPHPKDSKVIGCLDLDHVPVNFTKSAFIEDSLEYEQAVDKFTHSDVLQKMLRSSRTVDETLVPIAAVFDYFDGTGQPKHLAKRVSANLSKKMLNSSESFQIKTGKETATVSIKSLRDGSFYQIGRKDGRMLIIINRNSEVFKFVKNPLFLMAVIASEARLLADNRDLADIVRLRNNSIISFLDDWSAKEPIPRDRDTPIPAIAGYGLEEGLVELHEFLKARYEFKFQFTALSTLAPYLHNLPGQVIYSLHTTPRNGRYLAELLSDEFSNDLAVAYKPNRSQISALLNMRSVSRMVFVWEYSSISGSTIAEPEKAFVDLLTDIRAHGVVLPLSEAVHILEHMKWRNILNMEKLERYAKAVHKTAVLSTLLEMAD